MVQSIVVVTGALGFIGYHLIKSLTQYRSIEHIIGIDDLSHNAISEIRAMQGWQHDQRIELIKSDAAEALAKLPSADIVFHLACIVGPVRVYQEAGRLLPKTVRLTQALIDYATRTSAKIVNISSSEVYGGGREGRCASSLDLVIPADFSGRSEYAIAKLATEIQLKNLADRGRLKAISVRPFNVAGPYQNEKGGFVIPRFIRQALSATPLTVYGDGSQRRAFTHVYDFCSKLICLAEKDDISGCFNIGNANNLISIKELAEFIVVRTCSTSPIANVNPMLEHSDLFADAFEKWPPVDEVSWIGAKTIADIVDDTIDAYCAICSKPT